LHYSVRGSQSVRAAAGKEDRIDRPDYLVRCQEVSFPRPRGAAAHIDNCRNQTIEETDRTASLGVRICPMADGE
jgi:hypothetical protein